jgi:aryl-alcohol dehydrogenase-like predicted oxidoreductase
MRTTTIGTSGPVVGAIGLGCMGMSYSYDLDAPRDDATAISVIRQALDLGATLLDTADAYGPYVNEILVGTALSGGVRDRAVLATKVGLIQQNSSGSAHSSNTVPDGRPEHIRASIDESLSRLGTDRVDLYQLHRVDPAVPLEDSWGAMAGIVRSGKALHIGLSEVSVEQIQRAQAIHPVASVQSELSLWTRDPLESVLPYCRDNGIAFLPFSPLGRGFLAGRFNSWDELPANDFRRNLPRFQRDALKANLDIVAKVRGLADSVGASPAQVALAWVLSKGRYVIPIPGTKTPKYLADNIGAAEIILSDVQISELDALPSAEGGRY